MFSLGSSYNFVYFYLRIHSSTLRYHTFSWIDHKSTYKSYQDIILQTNLFFIIISRNYELFNSYMKQKSLVKFNFKIICLDGILNVWCDHDKMI